MRRTMYFITFGLMICLGIISFPVITRTFGVEVWTSLAAAQALGSLGGVACAFGFDTFGPGLMAKSPADNRWSLYCASLRLRIGTLCIVPVIVALSAYVVASSHQQQSSLIAALLCFNGLTAAWALIGMDRAITVFLVDSLPKLVCTATAILVVILGGSMWEYVVVLGAGYPIASLFGYFAMRRITRPDARPEKVIARQLVGGQISALVTSIASAGYIALPVVLVTGLVGTSAADYVVTDRFMRYGTAGLDVVKQAYQGWVPRGGAESSAGVLKRARRAIFANSLLGTALAIAFVFGLPILTSTLSAGALEPTILVTVPLAGALAFTAIAQCLGFVVLPLLGEQTFVRNVRAGGSVIGLPVVAFAAWAVGEVAVAWVVLAVIAAESTALWLRFRRFRQDAESSVKSTTLVA